jgi:type IV secretion system protein VirB1
MELMGCQDLAVPAEVMQHVVRVESSFNPYAIGVVGGRLVRQPKTLPEALATVRMLERRGYDFSVGLAQVSRKNLDKYGLDSYEKAFQACPNLRAGSRILAECYSRSKDSWPRSFSCYYSGDFTTGFRHGYVQKIYASIRAAAPPPSDHALAIEVVNRGTASTRGPAASSTRKEPREDITRIASTWAGDARTRDAAQEWGMSAPPRVPTRVSLVGTDVNASPDPRLPILRTMPGVPAPETPAMLTGDAQESMDTAFVF